MPIEFSHLLWIVIGSCSKSDEASLASESTQSDSKTFSQLMDHTYDMHQMLFKSEYDH